MIQAILGMLLLLGGVVRPLTAAADEATSQDNMGAAPSGEPAVLPLRISMDFQDASLKDVLKTFSQQSGINVIASGNIAEKRITLYLEDVEVLDVLDQILKAGDLTYDRPAGSSIYLVKPKPGGAQAELAKMITRVYKLKYARVSESNLAKAATAFGASTPFEGSLDTGGASQGKQQGGRSPASPASAGGTGIDKVIKQLLTKGGELVVDGRTNSLIITDIPGNFTRLEAALAALDVRTPQVLVDTEIIETTLTKLKELGVKWGTGTAGTIFQLTPAKHSTRLPFGDFFGRHGLRGNADVDTALTSTQLGTLDTAQAVMVLNALQTDTDSKILARPRVLTLDNESAVIRLTSHETIGFESSSQATTAVQTSTPERELTGVVLVVTPQINDHQDITMIVEPSVIKTVASAITPPTGQAQTRDPKTRSSRALVRIHSGDTLVVGGLIDRSDEDSLRKVPVLSAIPLLGEAFKEKGVTHTASELVVFVTPRIMDEPSDAQVASMPREPGAAHEQEPGPSRQDLMDQTLNRLETSSTH